jgi:hypothetical protein
MTENPDEGPILIGEVFDVHGELDLAAVYVHEGHVDITTGDDGGEMLTLSAGDARDLAILLIAASKRAHPVPRREDGWGLLDDVVDAGDDLAALVNGVFRPKELQELTHRLADAVNKWRESLDANLQQRKEEP